MCNHIGESKRFVNIVREWERVNKVHVRCVEVLLWHRGGAGAGGGTTS